MKNARHVPGVPGVPRVDLTTSPTMAMATAG